MNYRKPITFRLLPFIATEGEKKRALEVKKEIITFLLGKVMEKEKSD